ncbi:pantoate--beta-alanine ligase [Thiocystis violascens]|uniref:Pantothenate synthetase n=1 Tax=Thiocystis violascens (strain ATCC 17096 / DSM 198 / 6111) TaxID=765911 RepID=I3Y5B6_THIV6|nr:pantoate--beta-alanine ligase [Thiocystis violascens]AFL72184.1 pantothenate synthetase [Thiocystis violascens DSM 198]
MDRIEPLENLRARVAGWRAAGERVAFVPTMGNLHQGHLTLAREARSRAERVVVSIFVNPLQFGAGEDLDAYPRTLEEDRRLLDGTGCDLLFTPTASVVYPRGQSGQTRVEVPGLSDILCGATRPGHFVGVATVVCKLFNMVQPDVALFGEKDFQQLLVIRRMVEDLNLPVEIVGVPTVREPDGLAMSSRNGYLSPDERALAPALYRSLTQAGQLLRQGIAVDEVERTAVAALRESGLTPDYVTVRRADDLDPVTGDDANVVVLGAAYLGRARLIDNLRVTRIAAA